MNDATARMIQVFIRLDETSVRNPNENIEVLILHVYPESVLSEVAALHRALNPVRIILSFFERISGKPETTMWEWERSKVEKWEFFSINQKREF